MTRSRSRLAVGFALAALVVCAAGGGAAAAGLVGSKDIKDGSVRSVDTKDGSVAGRDVKDGSLRSQDFAGGLPTSTAGPDRVLTWSGVFTSDGRTGQDAPVLVSDDTIPAGSLVRGIDFTVTADHSACGALDVAVTPEESLWYDDPVAFAILRDPSLGQGPDEVALNDLVTKSDAPVHLAIAAICLTTGDNAVPSFDFTVTFSVTQLDLPATTTWN